MMRIQIKLLPSEASGLAELARVSLRSPREQVRFLVREELQRRGLLDAEAAEQREEEEGPDTMTQPGADGEK